MAKKKHRFLNWIRKFLPSIKKFGPNTALVIENKYTGSSSRKVKVFYNKQGQSGRGWRFIIPFLHETDIISIAEETIDYPTMSFNDRVGQKLTVDFTAKVKVVDARKYKYEHKNVKEQLESDLKSMVLPLIKRLDYEELSNIYFELPASGTKLSEVAYKVKDSKGNVKYLYKDSVEVDSAGRITKGVVLTVFEVELIKIREHFDKFEQDYGLKVINISNKEVNPSAEMQKSFDQVEKSRRSAAAEQVEAEKRLRVSEIDKQTIKNYQDIERAGIQAKLELYAAKGFISEEQKAMMIADMFAHGMQGGSQKSQNPALFGAGAAMGANFANQFMHVTDDGSKTDEEPKKTKK